MSINAQRHSATSITIWERQLPSFKFLHAFLSHPKGEQTIKPLKFRSDLSPFLFVFCEVHGIDLSTIKQLR